MTEPVVLEQQSTQEALKLQISRVIRAERARVYAAWTRPELMAQWFAPGTMTITDIAADLRPGGDYRIEVQGPIACSTDAEDAGKIHTTVINGLYQKIIPNELISFTWRGSRFPEENTLVTVTFKDVDGGTEVALTHENFSSAEVMGRHQQGWDRCFAKLVDFLEKQ